MGFEGIFLPHLLLYSTLIALLAAPIWFAFVRVRMVAAPQRGPPAARQLGIGVAGGTVALIASLAFVYLVIPAGTVHWIEPVPWKIAGNIFSNF